ncbi:hypothetical protein [Pseudomonas viridiflava]|uniref:hypothetical protein n=1 Tax=Pseudomonas viridiflava TaxID=33069 RepID=UPI00197D87B9|nr:hypothetical protein [Pseudomonas viridiflava]QXG48966.1 hypothetical protein KTT57_08070 [Pseudomonas viridiflava]
MLPTIDTNKQKEIDLTADILVVGHRSEDESPTNYGIEAYSMENRDKDAVLDLSKDSISSENIISPYIASYDSRPKEDDARRLIAFGLIGLLAVVILLAFFLFGCPLTDRVALKDFLNQILTPLFTLVSAATGFYYATRK